MSSTARPRTTAYPPPRDAGDGGGPVLVSVPLTGLTSDTTYHLRIVATNDAGMGRSADRTLRTARPATPQPPAVAPAPRKTSPERRRPHRQT